MIDLPGRRRIVLNAAFATMSVLYFVAGPWMTTDIFVLGWPLFAFWTVILIPLAITVVFAINSYYKLKEDEARAERPTSRPPEFGGN